MDQDQSFIKSVSAFNDGEYETAYYYMCKSSTVSPEKREEFLNNCRIFIVEQYSYLIKDAVNSGDYIRASDLKDKFINKYGESQRIIDIKIPEPRKSTLQIIDEPEPMSFWERCVKIFKRYNLIIISGLILVVCIIITILYLKSQDSHRYNDYSYYEPETVTEEVIEEVKEQPVLEEDDPQKFHWYNGEYSSSDCKGTAKYIYRLENGKEIYDGSFEFNGYLNEDPSEEFSMSGQFNNNIQDGEWKITLGLINITLNFKDGELNGLFEAHFTKGVEVSEMKGTYINGKLVGQYFWRVFNKNNANKNNFIISGNFDIYGKPVGIWYEITPERKIYYVMDEEAAESSGYKGRVIIGDDEVIDVDHDNLSLKNYVFNINFFIFRDTKKALDQNIEYSTYWN